jgi:hypothetical protein
MKHRKLFPIVAMLLIVLMGSCSSNDDNDPNARPTVTLTNPTSNETKVARNQTVVLNFSEAMDPATINESTFTLKQGITPVTGTVSSTGTTATFTPAVFLSANLVYKATITTGAKDVSGNSLATQKEFTFTTGGSSELAGVVLGDAGDYVILAQTAITNVPTSAIIGDVGLSPAATSYIDDGFALVDATGYATSAQVTGKVYASDMAAPTGDNLTVAVNNMVTAYNDAAGRPFPDFFELATGNIGGKTLVPGLYKWTNNVIIPTDVFLKGGANDVWIFQISGNLTMSAAKNIILQGDAQARNIYWQVAGQATIGTTAHFEGTILSKTGITFQTGASVDGRLLAQSAVILDSNVVRKPD